MRISIVGAGIGGLTLALALQQQGIQVDVYEQSKSFRKIGAGIILGNNAMQIYKKLGIDKLLQAKGSKVSSMNVTDQKNRSISSIQLEYFEKRFDSINLAIHRADLHEILVQELNQSYLHYSKKLVSCEQESNKVMLNFEDGESIESDLVIAADGIHSIIRKQIFPAVKYRSTNQICWRGVLNHQLSDAFSEVFTEMWGDGCRLGFGQINPKEVYWFALINAKTENNHIDDSYWIQYFDSFLAEAKSLIHKTDTSSIHKSILEDFQPITSWFNDRVCLLGDAAHAMTPNMGQGAGQSIEDAYYLSKVLSSDEMTFGLDPKKNSLNAYQQYRIEKVKSIVKSSWQIGKIAQLENAFLRGIRNSAMRLLPESISKKQMEKVFTI